MKLHVHYVTTCVQVYTGMQGLLLLRNMLLHPWLLLVESPS